MGLDKNGVRFLLYAKTRGTDFKDTATIGRQSLALDTVRLSEAFQEFGLKTDNAMVEEIHSGSDGYAEFLLTFLGARQVVSFDNSDYEQATRIYDFNNTIPADYEKKFTAVIDGGTLEHIYNFPVALNNCLNMVRPEGHFITITPANNFCGHGFYQFSPEIFFSVLCPENGFEIVDILSFEDAFDDRWYRIADPKALNRRITLRSRFPTYLLVLARRLTAEHIPLPTVHQSDYMTLWNGGSLNQDMPVDKGNRFIRFRRFVSKIVPDKIKKRIKRIIYPNPFQLPLFDPVRTDRGSDDMSGPGID